MKTKTIKRTIEVEVTLSPQEIAEQFWEMDSFGQSLFLEKLYYLSKDKLSWQLEYLSQEKNLTNGGRFVMSKFGEYANHNRPKSRKE